MANVDRLLLCSCANTMEVDGDSAAAALGATSTKICNELCGRDIEIAAGALAQEGTTVIACAQQAPLLADLFDEVEAPGQLQTVDIRDRAGWSDDKKSHPKQAALLAEGVLPRPNTATKDVISEGVCLILGGGEVGLDLAQRLSDRLAVTLLTDLQPAELSPSGGFDIALGKLKSASGSLGSFTIVVDGYAPLAASGRGGGHFAAPVNGAKSNCDIILDLRADTPLFPAPEKREGYLRADPRDPVGVEKAMFQASDLQGAFEKPLYIRYDAQLCAHSRASQQGCNRCLNVCPTGAILADGDHVSIDPDICAGCGGCAAVCPSGAASYDDPPATFLFSRLRTLASAYRSAGGKAPRLLFHDTSYGAEMIRLSARFGRGLPSDVIPVDVYNVEGVGHAEMLAALGVGFSSVSVLLGPQTDAAALNSEIGLGKAILDGTGRDDTRLELLDVGDPDALETSLYIKAPKPLKIDTILPVGGRREVTRLAANALLQETDSAPSLPLPSGAPYGAVVINSDACTLCLACVSLCPVGALADNPDKPQVNFQETACLQCGICANTCPENAISLVPQLNLGTDALSHQTLHQEEPFACIECGKEFGVKSTIERIVEKLEGKHWMFTGSDNSKLIQMCDDCRVNAQYHTENSPFKSADRPAVRTTEDYLAERKKPN